VITLKVNPIGKPRMTQSDKWRKRSATDKYWAYKDALIWLAKSAGYVLGDTLQADFFIEMPKSWSNKKKAEMDGKPHRDKPDLDNIEKGFYDALLKDDSGIYKNTTAKYWSYEGKIVIY